VDKCGSLHHILDVSQIPNIQSATHYPILVRGQPLTLSGRGCSLSDEGDRLCCIGIVVESKHGRILTADHLSQHEAQIDTGISQRLGDSVAKTRSVVALHEHGRDEATNPADRAASIAFLPDTGCSSMAALPWSPGYR
jgi:hypothetical protein